MVRVVMRRMMMMKTLGIRSTFSCFFEFDGIWIFFVSDPAGTKSDATVS